MSNELVGTRPVRNEDDWLRHHLRSKPKEPVPTYSPVIGKRYQLSEADGDRHLLPQYKKDLPKSRDADTFQRHSVYAVSSSSSSASSSTSSINSSAHSSGCFSAIFRSLRSSLSF